MKILRSVNRRGFNVGTAGWFTVLRPNTWFPASRLRKTFPAYGMHAEGRAEQAAGARPVGEAGGRATVARWRAMERGAEDRNRLRSGSAIFGAMAITAAMLWWIMHP
jgi:hypothetical protein